MTPSISNACSPAYKHRSTSISARLYSLPATAQNKVIVSVTVRPVFKTSQKVLNEF